jgi:hypothetical protein
MAGQPGWNNNPFGTMGHFEAGMGAHTNMFGIHGPTYGEQGLPTAPTNNPLQLTVQQKMQELTNRACTGNLSIADMNSLKVLKATLPAPNTNSTLERGENISIQFCNILGWAGFTTNQKHFLHQETNGKWMKFLAATTKAERKAIVKSNFVQPLIQQDPLFASILTDDFADTILSCQFAPKNYSGMKPTGGMGPLTFISRSTAEHENLEYFNRLNAAASERTTADIERAKAGTPILPTDIDGLLNVIVLNQMAIASSLTQWAAPAQGIRTLIGVLRANYTRLKGMVNFQETFGNEIIFQLCHHLDNYFSTYCTEQDLLQGNFPQFNIDFLIQGIENNNLAPSFSHGPLFASTRPTTPTPTGATAGARTGTQARRAGTKRTNDGTAKHTQRPQHTAPKDTGKITRNGQGCEEQKRLINEYLKNHEYVPKIADIRIANGLNTDKDLYEALGVPEGTCLVWVLYCTCKQRCRRKGTHGFDTTKFKPTKAVEILRKGLLM